MEIKVRFSFISKKEEKNKRMQAIKVKNLFSNPKAVYTF